MGGDFIFFQIAQDAFDPVALADEVAESGVSSVKHEMGSQPFSGRLSCQVAGRREHVTNNDAAGPFVFQGEVPNDAKVHDVGGIAHIEMQVDVVVELTGK